VVTEDDVERLDSYTADDVLDTPHHSESRDSISPDLELEESNAPPPASDSFRECAATAVVSNWWLNRLICQSTLVTRTTVPTSSSPCGSTTTTNVGKPVNLSLGVTASTATAIFSKIGSLVLHAGEVSSLATVAVVLQPVSSPTEVKTLRDIMAEEIAGSVPTASVIKYAQPIKYVSYLTLHYSTLHYIAKTVDVKLAKTCSSEVFYIEAQYKYSLLLPKFFNRSYIILLYYILILGTI